MAAESRYRGGLLLRLLGGRVRLAYLAGVALFLWAVAQFYHADTGFSSLVSIGDMLGETQVSALRGVRHYVYESAAGYDGAYYAQIAFHPTLDNPELAKAIDNLPYRARRILFCWVAWLLGLGQPAWVLQVHALLNVACWLALAVVLLRWFPPTGWENGLRWAGVMFSHGLCMSVRHSLVDGPALLLVALALRALERGRPRTGAAVLALAGLGKETSLLAAGALDAEGTGLRRWLRHGVRLLLVAAPLLAWMAYVRWQVGPAGDKGLGNFTLPLVGLGEKALRAVRDAFARDGSALHWATLAVVVALVVQALFFALRRRPAERWWRVGAAFVVLMAFVATPVWEGFPGAATRVLLPMTLAFNVLVPRGARWLPVLLAGNLTVVASVFEFSPPHEFYVLRGDPEVRAAVRVVAAKGWHGPERHLEQHWRWSRGDAELRFVNESGGPLLVAVRGQVSTAGTPRRLRVAQGERLLWSGDLVPAPRELRFGFTLPEGETTLTFATDRPPEKVGTDPRDLAVRAANLEVVVRPGVR